MTCQALWEPTMRPRDTHDCRFTEGHEGDHQCSLCASWWDRPKRDGGQVTTADERKQG